MTGTARARQPLWIAGAATVVAVAALVAVVGTTGSDHGGSALTPAQASTGDGRLALGTPLATSLRTTSGTWATVPMGHLGHPLNTFWQLFGQTGGTGDWSNHVEATATATNGGLALDGAAGGGLVVGVLPSQMLTYSPLITTADGTTWSSTGVLDRGLAAHPAALASGPADDSAALVVSGAHVGAVVTSEGSLSSWTTATTGRQLASTPAGQRCQITGLTAVAYLGDSPLVGTGCARPGVVGIFVEHHSHWQAAGPARLASARAGAVEVLWLQSTADGVTALFGAADPDGTEVWAGWLAPGGSWTVSGALHLTPTEHLTSVGPAGGAGAFVLVSAPSGTTRLAVAGGPASADVTAAGSATADAPAETGGADITWHILPAPPAGTATVAFDATTIDALAVHDTQLTVWTMPVSTGSWTEGQVLKVAVPFTSSQ